MNEKDKSMIITLRRSQNGQPLSWSIQAAVTEIPWTGGLNSKIPISHTSGGWEHPKSRSWGFHDW
jgi:hypothetical protein